MAKAPKEIEEVKADMTPMIDCTFLLLIFFILTLKFKILEGRLDAALPKDMGTKNTKVEEIEKVDILLMVSKPGELVDEVIDGKTTQLKRYVGREVRYEVGTQVFRNVPDLERFLATVADKDETPVTIDPRKDIVNEDVMLVLDAVIRQKFQKVSFAGTQENE
jgi:biopolymer transport protein ExbD